MNFAAMQVNRDLLGFCKDKDLPDPNVAGQSVLRKGFTSKPLRDEIYVQVIKQAINNPKSESMIRAWQMICMCLGTFAPSPEFLPYLSHFIVNKRDLTKGAVSEYAKYAVRALEGIARTEEGSGYILSPSEIDCYKDRPPVLATITLLDGSIVCEDLPVPPHLSVEYVLELCFKWLNIKDPRSWTLGIFVYDLGDSVDPSKLDEATKSALYRQLPRTPRPLRSEDFLGDIFVQKTRQKRNYKLVLKKKVYLQHLSARGFDPVFERLVYLNADDEARNMKHIVLKEEERVVAMAGMSMVIALGDQFGKTAEELEKQNASMYAVTQWRAKKNNAQWARAIFEIREALVTMDAEDMMESYIRSIQSTPLCGTNWFYVFKEEPGPRAVLPEAVKSLPRDMMIGFNQDGMTFFTLDFKILIRFSFADIYRWGGTPTQFSFILNDSTGSVPDPFELTMVTAQATDMAATIVDLMKAVVLEKESNVVLVDITAVSPKGEPKSPKAKAAAAASTAATTTDTTTGNATPISLAVPSAVSTDPDDVGSAQSQMLTEAQTQDYQPETAESPSGGAAEEKTEVFSDNEANDDDDDEPEEKVKAAKSPGKGKAKGKAVKKVKKKAK